MVLCIGALPFKLCNRPLTLGEFKDWLSGFTDGEGSFGAHLNPAGRLHFTFKISVHVDDIAVLLAIQLRLCVGSVTVSKRDPSVATFSVGALSDLIEVIVPLFTAYPLITTKVLNFEAWKAILLMVLANGSRQLVGQDLARAIELIKGMNSTRTDFTLPYHPNLPVIRPLWLLGFLEAEGTFGLKSLLPVLQVGQLMSSTLVLDAIAAFLKALPLPKAITGNNPLGPMMVSTALNQRTDVRVITVTSVGHLYYVIMPFLLSMPWQSRKGVDFEQWCLALYLYQTGRAYTPEGRQLLVDMSRYMNDGRYSNHLPAPVGPPSGTLIQTVLDLPVPMERPEGMSQTEFAKAVRRLYPVQVYVYDSGVLMPGSPFLRMARACEAAKLPTASRIVSRYLDTGKLHEGRYLFTSKPL